MEPKKRRGRPAKNPNGNIQKTAKEISEENIKKIRTELAEKERVLNMAEREVAILKAQLKIEEFDETTKTVFLKKQDMALNYIKCVCTLDGIEDVLNKLGINSISDEETECGKAEKLTEAGDREAIEMTEGIS